VIIQGRDTKHGTGHVGLGKMKLMEIFSRNPDLDSNKDKRLDPDINYLEDLKFFIDNDNDILSHEFFPAIIKHKKNINNEDAYKFYVKPVLHSMNEYCKKFKLSDVKEKIFTEDSIIELSKKFAEVQKKIIEDGEYD